MLSAAKYFRERGDVFLKEFGRHVIIAADPKKKVFPSVSFSISFCFLSSPAGASPPLTILFILLLFYIILSLSRVFASPPFYVLDDLKVESINR